MIQGDCGYVVCGFQTGYFYTWFSVMTDTKFHFSWLDEKVWFAYGRNRTRSQPNANTPRTINCSLSDGDHLIQRTAERRAGAADFPHQNLPRDPTTLGGLRFRSRRDIIVSHHGLHFDAFGCGQLLGHFYIQVIARVIPVETSDSRSTVRHPECVQKRLGGGRTKYLPDGDSVAEVFANVPDKRGLVSRSASGNDTDFIFHRCFNIFQYPRVFRYRCHEVRMRFHKSMQHLFDYLIRVIDNSLHHF